MKNLKKKLSELSDNLVITGFVIKIINKFGYPHTIEFNAEKEKEESKNSSNQLKQ